MRCRLGLLFKSSHSENPAIEEMLQHDPFVDVKSSAESSDDLDMNCSLELSILKFSLCSCHSRALTT
jgi:hypothetical protein